MKFVKGMTKPPNSGRKLGVKNKKTLAFLEACDEQGFLIVEELIDLYKETEDERMKLEILKEMAKYSYAIPKELEQKPEDSATSFVELLKDVSSPDLKALLTKKESSNE